MNFEPVNGLRLLGTELGILVAVFAVSFVSLPYLRRLPWLQWPKWLFASSRRPTLFVILLALVGRACLLPLIGIPEPHINDEYSYLLMADTFANHRLANPTPPEWQSFETFHVTLTPTYHSKYPIGQGAFLALGQVIFHNPWIGVYLSTALLCGAICWALQAFLSPTWAFVGGLLALFRFALFSYWMNSYWGGSVPAVGGALALGGVVRLFEVDRTARYRIASGAAFALGLLILANSRPYEGFAFSIPLLAYFLYKAFSWRRHQQRIAIPVFVPVLLIGTIGIGFMAYYNYRTTGDPFLMPRVQNERTYAPLPAFIGQKKAANFVFTDPVFAKYYQVEAQEHHYLETVTLAGLADLELRRWSRNWFFYVGPAMSLPLLLGLVCCAKNPQLRIAVLCAITTLLAVSACNWNQMHYYAPALIAVYLFIVEGLRYLWDTEGRAGQAFVVAVVLTVALTSLMRSNGSTTADRPNFPDGRKAVAERLKNEPGRQLVLVSYDLDKHYPGDELVHNSADFASQKILWARSKGAERDRDLCRAYSDRSFWSVTTDDFNISLKPLDLCNSGSPLLPGQPEATSH
ncbi:MAG: hypothetical protein WAM71_09405 [Candidatus Korobacteraceae bacterium]